MNPSPQQTEQEQMEALSRQLLSSGSRLNRNSPWDAAGHVPEEESCVDEARGEEKFRAPLLSELGSKPWWTRDHALTALEDWWVGFFERRRRSPSLKAVAEAIEYYAGLYQERAPDPTVFARLLKRRGIPDWANPYPQGEELHYALHPEGFIAADLSEILEQLTREWDRGESAPPGPSIDELLGSEAEQSSAPVSSQAPGSEAPLANPRPEEALEENHEEGSKDSHRQALHEEDDFAPRRVMEKAAQQEALESAQLRDGARRQWLQMLLSGLPFGRVAQAVHPDNLFFASFDAALHSQRLGMGSFEQAAQAAQRKGWGTPAMWQAQRQQHQPKP